MVKLLRLIAVLFYFATLTFAQETVTVNSDPADLSRPLSTVVSQIRRQTKLSVTYEDPRYTSPADLEDVTSRVEKSSDRGKGEGPRIIVPKGHPITFVYSPSEMKRLDSAKQILSRLVREYAIGGGPAFTVEGDGTRVHVLPSKVGAGLPNHPGSILETRISVSAASRDGGQLLQAICDKIQKKTGFEVGIGPSVPNNYLARYHTSVGVSGESARKAIANLLDASSASGAFDWDLYYDPVDKSYMLNFAYSEIIAVR